MAFPTAWDRVPGGSTLPVRSLSKHGEAYISIGSTTPDVDLNDETPPIYLNAESSTVAMRGNTGAIADAGAFTCDVRRVVTNGATTASELVAQLSASTPAAYNCPPGEYIIICTTSADAAGYVWIQGRNA